MNCMTQPYGPVDSAALVRFERSLPATLPEDLREFLFEFNGAEFSDADEISDVPGGTALGDVFGLHGGPEYLRLDHMFLQFASLVPESILVFASDPFGNYFGISLSGPDAEFVYFLDHETLPASRGSLVRVALSFTEFLQRAGDDCTQPAAITTISGAIDAGDNETLLRLLGESPSLNGAVHRAVHHGDSRILVTVLKNGGDPNERGAIGGTETPLFVAARQGRADLAELLVRYGADPNARCGAGGTALEMAKPWPSVANVLRKAGAKI